MKGSVAAGVIAALLVAGCGDSQSDAKKSAGPAPTPITAAKAEVRTLELTEDSVGSLEHFLDPKVGAEVAGRVVSVTAFVGKKVKRGDALAEIDPVDLEIQNRGDAAEVARLETLVANQERIVANQQKLVEKAYISQNAVDDSIAQRNALAEQLKSARARLDANRNALRKTKVVAPIDGEVEVQVVAAGDYVKVGDPLFQLVGTSRVHAHLPFPESAGPRLRIGQPVRITSPLVPGVVIQAKIDEIRPSITATTRALDVIVKFDTDGKFRGGGTVNAQVVTGRRENAVVLPEQSIVLRPAGKVVYLVQDGKAVQRVVETGVRKDGIVEIVSGLAGGETVAADGAGFLTNNAPIAVAKPRAEMPGVPAAGGAPGAGGAADKGAGKIDGGSVVGKGGAS